MQISIICCQPHHNDEREQLQTDKRPARLLMLAQAAEGFCSGPACMLRCSLQSLDIRLQASAIEAEVSLLEGQHTVCHIVSGIRCVLGLLEGIEALANLQHGPAMMSLELHRMSQQHWGCNDDACRWGSTLYQETLLANRPALQPGKQRPA